MQEMLREQAEAAAEKAAEKAEKEAWRAANPEEAAAEDAERYKYCYENFLQYPNLDAPDDTIASAAHKEAQDWRVANPEAYAVYAADARAKRIADLVELYIGYAHNKADPNDAEEVEAK